MPIPEDYQDICQMLLDATRQNRVKWEDEGASIGVRLPDLTIEIWSGTDERSEQEFVGVGLKDPATLRLIDEWYVEDGDKNFVLLHDLWDEARRKARRIPEKLEALRQLLKKGCEIGDDGIPF